MLIWFETQDEADHAVADVAALSPAARTLLSQIIETQGKPVTKVSKAALKLEDLGFIHIRNETPYDTTATLVPSLWGEEALDLYEQKKVTGRNPPGY